MLLLPGCFPRQDFAQTPPPTDSTAKIKELFDGGHWDSLVNEVESTPSPRGAETDFYYGIALANLGRWGEARAAFLAGRRLRPRDERFPIELGGIAFKQKRY
ncbi:MAG: hypothetical protein LAP13_18575, partial [Acidobacteriia bacterium]|nr:hypothetical protein [Terriglobia bacterium]